MRLLNCHLQNRVGWTSLVRYLFYLTLIITSCDLEAQSDDSIHLSDNHATKIVCIGDSITQGGKLGLPEYTYRLPLYYLAASQGYQVDFIGTRQQGLNAAFTWPETFDKDHEGYYGKNSAYIRDAVIEDLEALEPPDIAIIHIGTNDKDSISSKPIVKPTKDIINALRAKNPHVKILIVQIPGKLKYLYTHLWMWWLATFSSTKESPIYTVDIYSNWDSKVHTFDGAHPNLIGQSLIAEHIFEKLETLLNS